MTGAGIVLAVGGAMIMKGMEDSSSSSSSSKMAGGGGSEIQDPTAYGDLGMFLVALGAFTSAVYFIIQKPTLSKYPPITVTAWEYLVCCVFMACAAVRRWFHRGCFTRTSVKLVRES